jgi:hypothetical protein
LIRWNNKWNCIEWLEDKLLSLPHCVVRKLFEQKGYRHESRLRTAHALELQHTVLSWKSRIGLEVQPPFPKECSIGLLGRNPDDSFVRLDKEAIAGAALLFNAGDKPALVLRAHTYQELHNLMEKHLQATLPSIGANTKAKNALTQGAEEFAKKLIGMKYPILFPEAATAKALRILDGRKKEGTSISQLALRVGPHEEALSPGQKEYGFCITAIVND